jgi:ABC-2 type transport system permease protein
VAVVLEDPSPAASELASSFTLSRYFDAQLTVSMRRAEELMRARKVDGIVRLRPDFSRRLASGGAEVQIVVHGVDANRARIIQNYAQGAIGVWAARRGAEGREVLTGPVRVQSRLWFNEANESRHFLVPGLVVLVMTLIGALLTSLVMAREWERGTIEALFVTPVRPEEILLGKTIPYFVLGMIGLGLCLLAAKFLFYVPFRGSLAVLIGVSVLYLLVALALGLLISSAVKNQFVASQITAAGDLSSGGDALGFFIRSAQFARGGATADLSLAGALLRRLAANDISRRRYLVGDFAERRRAGGHDGRTRAAHTPGDAQETRLRQA